MLGFIIGVLVFVIIAATIAFKKNKPRNLYEIRAFIFIETLNGGYYNANGANRIAEEMPDKECFKLAPHAYRAIKKAYGNNPEKLISDARANGFKLEEKA
ncbi:hypothetical protein ACJVQT_23080 [Enterobacter huaxiensis]|uniref:hypothetical protein n=1 Tax=Enterobacter huaxiensis TaxID=2494702 RepID=UPI00217590D4|nr:hypothetical protein [Enterobacter huaxiensis]MCS5452551.1 hypothetical protein [Enterobacter huaxiensis]